MADHQGTIIIGGDIYPGGRNLPFFLSGDSRTLFNDLLFEFERADVSIVNLECPLISYPSPITKSGPSLRADPACISSLKFVDVLNLANNHILDHGPEGLSHTIAIAQEHGISCVGAGENLRAAGRVLVRDVHGLRVGILGMAEHESSIATPDSWGANALDPVGFVRTVRLYRHQWDYLIVLVHGGVEHYPYPRPKLMELCRFMVEEGANAIVCQHTHCPGCYEIYSGAPIVYGQGNLIFDWPGRQNNEWNQGFLVRLLIDQGVMRPELLPYTQSRNSPGVNFLKGAQADRLLTQVYLRSKAIQDHAFVEREWKRFCENVKHKYMSLLFRHGYVLSKINQKLKISDYVHRKNTKALMLNLIRSESLREILETILN